MKTSVLYLFLILASSGFSQNPDGFDKMCKGYISGTVPLAQPQQLKFDMSKNPDIVILDSREKKEYDISHIKGAKYVGYDDFKISNVSGVSKNSKVYVYCSIGYRSEKVGEKLQQAGFKSVYNLYGGIFNWANNGYPLENKDGKLTNVVHGYDNKWAKWLNEEKCKKTIK